MGKGRFRVKVPPRETALVERLEKENAIFFFKVMTPIMISDDIVKGPFALQLEFPVDFIKKHGYGDNCNLSYPVRLKVPHSEKEWDLETTDRKFPRNPKVRVFAYGDGGWRDFGTHNKVAVGDFLVFHLVGFSRFEVYIQRLSSPRRPSKWRFADNVQKAAHMNRKRRHNSRRSPRED